MSNSSAWPLSPLPLTPEGGSRLSPAVTSLKHLIAQRTEELTHLGDARAAALAQRVRDLEAELSAAETAHNQLRADYDTRLRALDERDAALAAAQSREAALSSARDAAEAGRAAALAELDQAHARVRDAVSAAAAAEAARESLALEMVDALRCAPWRWGPCALCLWQRVLTPANPATRSVEAQIEAERSTAGSAIDSLTHELVRSDTGCLCPSHRDTHVLPHPATSQEATKQQLRATEVQLEHERSAATALAERLNRDLVRGCTSAVLHWPSL